MARAFDPSSGNAGLSELWSVKEEDANDSGPELPGRAVILPPDFMQATQVK